MAPKCEFEPSGNGHEAGTSRQVTLAAFDMGPPSPIRDRIYVTVMVAQPVRDRIYVTVVVAQIFWEASAPMLWGDMHLPTAVT
jgi:hypothetical protein